MSVGVGEAVGVAVGLGVHVAVGDAVAVSVGVVNADDTIAVAVGSAVDNCDERAHETAISSTTADNNGDRIVNPSAI